MINCIVLNMTSSPEIILNDVKHKQYAILIQLNLACVVDIKLFFYGLILL